MTIYDISGLRCEYIKPDTNLTVWGATHKPFALMNASLYDGGISTYKRPAGPPVGTTFEEGRLVRNEGNYPGVGIKNGKLTFGGPYTDAWEYFMAGYNTCVMDMNYVKPDWDDQYVFNSKNYRIGIGKMPGKTVIVTDDNVTLKQFATNAIKKGVIVLCNMDGGGSRHLLYNGRLIHQSPRIPYNALAFYKDSNSTEVNTGCPYNEPQTMIRMWSIGEGAKWVQWQLTRNGYPCDDDGYFFGKSVTALKAFQTEHGLTADGICGPVTREALKN